MVVLHFSRSIMKNFMPELDEYVLHCARSTLQKEQLDAYLKICDLLRELPPLYIMQPFGYMIKSHAIAMEIFFELLNAFGEKKILVKKTERSDILVRLGEITDYIYLHHAEVITLEDISSHFYLSREYFSRFFRKNMGITFTHYLNQVRLMHIYQDICNTQVGIMELAERHGFTNYKMFNKMFRDIYGCTAREIRWDSKRGI